MNDDGGGVKPILRSDWRNAAMEGGVARPRANKIRACVSIVRQAAIGRSPIGEFT